MNRNDNSKPVDQDSINRLTVSIARDGATITERARCMGLVRVTGEAAEKRATTEEERHGVRALADIIRAMIVHPELEVRRPAVQQPKKLDGGDPVRIDMFVTLIAEFLRVRRGQVLTDEMIIERARNGAVYLEEALREYEGEDTLPGVQVTVADTASAAPGKN
jgi:hypothetical protein